MRDDHHPARSHIFVRLLRQRMGPRGLRMNLPALRPGHGAHDDPADAGQIDRAGVIEQRLESHVIVLCLYIFPQRVNAPKLRFSGDRNAEPGIVQIRTDIQQIGAFAEKQELMPGIIPNLCEYLLAPLQFPARQVTHTCQQEVLWARLVHHPQLSGKEFRL